MMSNKQIGLEQFHCERQQHDAEDLSQQRKPFRANFLFDPARGSQDGENNRQIQGNTDQDTGVGKLGFNARIVVRVPAPAINGNAKGTMDELFSPAGSFFLTFEHNIFSANACTTHGMRLGSR